MTDINKIKLKMYFILVSFNFSKVKIFTVIKTNKGFNNSMGCNLKKYRSNQRLAPFTSTPIIGTKAKRIKEMIKK